MSAAAQAGYRAIDSLVGRAHLAVQQDLPGIVASAAGELGARGSAIYLADLQQRQLILFGDRFGEAAAAESMPMDSTLPGRAFQQSEVLTQASAADGLVRVWLSLIDGTDRVGVLALDVDEAWADMIVHGELRQPVERFAAVVAEILTTKAMYGDHIALVRRQAPMGVAAELQWSLLPPLTFACSDVTVAAALEPAYEVAGDTVDYAVDAGVARAAVFDSMGHSLRSSAVAAVAVAAYRNARRGGLDLPAIADAIDSSVLEVFQGSTFTTAVLAELDTDTGMFSWVNAGHPRPLLLRRGQVVKVLESSPRAPLGLRLPEDSPARQLTIATEQLEPGDRVLLYTDGVTEARSPDGEFFGEQRLTDLLMRNFSEHRPGPETLRRVVRALLDHQRRGLDDDATMVLLEWRAGTAEAILPH